jgi:anaerobic magnesium-protoporphyrin IX monomethyl ester cyclase
MKIYYLIPQYVENFGKSARWQTISRGYTLRHPELQLVSVAVLEKAGHEVEFCDATSEKIGKREVFRRIERFKPDMLVIYCTTPSIYDDISYVIDFKKRYPDKTTAVIGAHVSAEWKDTLKIAKNKYLDYVCIGEYDYSLRDIAGGMKPEKILGIAWLKKGKPVLNKPRPLLDVRELPFPAWHHVKPENYPDPGKLHPFITVIGCRGCMGCCTFCLMSNVMYKHQQRCRTVKQICDEIEHDLKLFPYLKEIMFEDDTFGFASDHAMELCNEIIRRKLNKRVSFACNLRVDIRRDLIPKLKEAGFRWACVGFEFGTDKSLKSIGKRATIAQAREFAHLSKKYGLQIHGCFMFGAPGETKEDCRKTIEFAKSLPLDTVQFSGIAVYPGTPLYTWTKQNNFLVPKDWKDWVTKEYKQASLLNYPQLSNEDINRFIDKGLKEWYVRPSQVLRLGRKALNSRGEMTRILHGFKGIVRLYFNKKKDYTISQEMSR